LLHELRRSTEDHTTEVLGLSVREKQLGRNLAAASSLANGILDDSHLDNDLRVVTSESVKPSKDGRSLFFAVMGKQPSRRFGKVDHHDENDDSKYKLEGDGEPPGELVRAIQTAVVDPVCDQSTDCDHAALDTDDFAAVPRFAAPEDLLAKNNLISCFRNLLCLVSGNGRCVDAVPQTSNESSDDKLSGCTAVRRYACNLDDHANNHDEGSYEDGLAATEFVAEQEDGNGTEETTASVDGYDEALVGTVTLDLGECGLEARRRDDTAHNTLIVTEEQEVGHRNGGDEHLKGPAGAPPVCGHTRVVVLYACHGGW
jgi:hypothetical protein